MNKNKKHIIELKIKRTAKALEKNNFKVFCAENKEEALKILESLLREGSTVGVGGSVTLDELGVIEFLRNGPYEFFDRYDKTLGRDGALEMMKKALTANVFIASSNAITENGELYNVDGNANRVAPMLFGPESVVIIAGYNKIVEDLEMAEKRVKSIVAPANCVRLGLDNPCTVHGGCVNCKSETRICADTVIMSRQRIKDRVKVILVSEELGY